MSQVKKYFRTLMGNHDNQLLKSVFIDLLDCKKKVAREVRIGHTEVNEERTDLDTFLYTQKSPQNDSEARSKRLLLQKEIESLNMRREEFESEEEFKRAKQAVIMQRQEEIREEKKERERKKIEMEERVKKWSEEQKELLKKKEAKLTEEEKIRQMEEMEQKKRLQKEKEITIMEKRRKIEQSLRIIEENRMKRQDMIRSMRSQSQDQIPLYVEYQRRAKQLEDERKFQQKIMLKNHRLSMRMDYEKIKQHDAQLAARHQERRNLLSETRTRDSTNMAATDFNVFTNKSEQRVKEELEKVNRRWKYQEKIKSIPIQIDESKKVEIEIALDKSKNPFKYNFLSQKSLNEFQIFGQFKNFSINTNPRELGKNYLEQLRKLPKDPSIQKSSSLQLIKQSAVSERPQYRNYLTEMKSKRPDQGGKIEVKDQIEKIVANKNKDEAYRQLREKSVQLDTKVQEKKRELKTISHQNIKSILKKQSEVDQAYSKALKAKLASVQILS